MIVVREHRTNKIVRLASTDHAMVDHRRPRFDRAEGGNVRVVRVEPWPVIARVDNDVRLRKENRRPFGEDTLLYHDSPRYCTTHCQQNSWGSASLSPRLSSAERRLDVPYQNISPGPAAQRVSGALLVSHSQRSRRSPRYL
jgi:hypothetical protein